MDRHGLLALLVVLLVSGCSASSRAVHVRVATPAGAPVHGATIAWTCTPTGDAGGVTGTDGTADLVIFNSESKRCVVTIAKPGYHTQQRTVEQLAEPVTVELSEVAP